MNYTQKRHEEEQSINNVCKLTFIAIKEYLQKGIMSRSCHFLMLFFFLQIDVNLNEECSVKQR